MLPTHAWLINVGRGATVDERALVEHNVRAILDGTALRNRVV